MMKIISNITPKVSLLMLVAFVLLVNEANSTPLGRSKNLKFKREDPFLHETHRCIRACAQCAQDDLYNNKEEVCRTCQFKQVNLILTKFFYF